MEPNPQQRRTAELLKQQQPSICHCNHALRPIGFCETYLDLSNQKTKALNRVMVELIRMAGLQSLYSLAHCCFTFSRHIRNFMKSASAFFFCPFHPTFNKIQAYVRLIPYYTLNKFAYGKCGTKINVWRLSLHSDVAQYSNLLEYEAVQMSEGTTILRNICNYLPVDRV
jgi:hypothetical protein